MIRLLALAASTLWAISAGWAAGNDLTFDSSRYTVKTAALDGKAVTYRAYEGIVYVKNPIDPRYQTLNFYAPTQYFEGKSVGEYTAATAPIFFPNSVGGYMPGEAAKPDEGMDRMNRTMVRALAEGFVVAAPGARGRTLTGADGQFTGKAPAAIVDLKAAVRYLRFNAARIPGNVERIVSNGTSAGGALSVLLGATGNNSDYEPYLRALGAAETRDDVWAVSAYCPITNLDHADAAYEWLLGDLKGTKDTGPMPPMPPGGAPGPWGAPPQAQSGPLTAAQVALSAQLKTQFPGYVNGLGLKKADGSPLTLNPDGSGSFRDFLKDNLIASAQKALRSGADLSKLPWVKVSNGIVTDLDWSGYLLYCGRKKAVPAFDALDLSSGENNEFGTRAVNNQHFTAFGQAHNSAARAAAADQKVVKMMNPMDYLGVPGTTVSTFWRIRQGTLDSDTSLAIPTLLAVKLANTGASVDFALPWDRPHSGDYDLDDLFSWVTGLEKSVAPGGQGSFP